MTVTRPKRLTTVVAEPMLLPMQTPPALPEPALEEPDFEGYVEEEPEPAPPRPRVVEVKVEEVNDLSDMRMRPRRVIVVK